MRIIISATQNVVRVLFTNCLSFAGCQIMNYALLKFLDVNRVNVFAIYLY